jgi:hypothetical protein
VTLKGKVGDMADMRNTYKILDGKSAGKETIWETWRR